jgi:ERCC4-type nuclease
MDNDLKKAYQEKMEKQMKEWGGKLEELKNRAESLNADAKVKALEKIESLKSKMKAGDKSLEQLKGSGEDQWDELKMKLDGTLEGIKNGIEDIKSRF